MENYKEKFCSVCGKTLSDTDDSVFCPVCGAPHHRECYRIKNECEYSSLHGTDNQYTPDIAKILFDRKEAGEPLDAPIVKTNDYTREEKFKAVPESGDGNTEERIPFRDLRDEIKKSINDETPKIPPQFLGGYNENDDIGGVTAGDAARFVSFNPNRFVPLFAKMALAGKKAAFNFFAFLLPEAWFFLRKNYYMGAAVSLLLCAADLMMYPAMLFFNNVVPESSSYLEYVSVISANLKDMPKSALIVMLASIVLNITIRLVCGVFGDYFYKLNAYSKIRNFKRENPDDDGIGLLRLGGINPFAMLIGFAITSFLPSLILSLI